jgi:hypothetical protein
MKLLKFLLFIIIAIFLFKFLLSLFFSLVTFLIIGVICVICLYIGWRIFIR